MSFQGGFRHAPSVHFQTLIMQNYGITITKSESQLMTIVMLNLMTKTKVN